MSQKVWLLAVGSYVVAISVNLLPSLFYPDSQFTPWMIGFSAMFLILLVLFVNRIPLFSKGNFVMMFLFLLASFGCAFIFIVNALGWTWSEWIVLNLLSNGQFIFYLLFVVPLFGLNYFIELPFDQFSLLVGIFYLFLAGSLLLYKKRKVQKGGHLQ